MPVDWPSPSPEPEVRARVRARTRTLRRRRSLPVVAVLAALPLALVASPDPSAHVRVATDGESPSTTEPGQGHEKPADTTTTSTTSTTTTIIRPPGRVPTSSPIPENTPGTRPEDPVTVGDPFRGFPESPAYAKGHPLLEDPQGDAWVDTAPARNESDPTVDIVHLDVRANATGLTTELRLLDLTRDPLASFSYGRPSSVEYKTTLRRTDDGYFSFYVTVRDGTVTTQGLFWTPHADAGGAGAWGSEVVENVTGTVNRHTGAVEVTVAYEDLNRAMALHSPDHEPMGRGTVVVPQGEAARNYTHVYETSHVGIDNVFSSDPDFAYRLGD